MLTNEQYNRLTPYKPIIELFIKTGEYVGGGEEFFKIMENDHGMPYIQGCVDCKSGMLTLAKQLIDDYERNMPGV